MACYRHTAPKKSIPQHVIREGTASAPKGRGVTTQSAAISQSTIEEVTVAVPTEEDLYGVRGCHRKTELNNI